MSILYLETKKSKIRILTPFEYDNFVTHIRTKYHRTLFDVCLFSGMRYAEILKLYKHPEWVISDRNIIRLPREADAKVKRVAPGRSIPIPMQLQGILPYFFTNKQPPTRKVWNDDLTRWAKEKGSIGEEYIMPKMTRATIESWMYVAGVEPMEIYQRQGHTMLVSLNHYKKLSLEFTVEERNKIIKDLASWKQ